VLGLASNNVPFGAAIARLLDGGTKADVIVQALEKRGLARRLAEPNLVALSGDTASFLAGGEFPFPVAAENNRITVEFKKFGVGLAFTPTVLDDGLINVKIEPEVSELDPTTTIRVENVEVPSLIIRRAQTTIELRDGQSFAVAGLLSANNFKNQKQLPWIGEVPVLGTLFRSAAFQKKETDLVIIVTPHLVKPARPGEKLVTPLDGRVSSNDREFFLRGQQEVKVGRPQAFHGHILDLEHEQPVAGDLKKGTKNAR
jgi:pilus assembly protein CpaC